MDTKGTEIDPTSRDASNSTIAGFNDPAAAKDANASDVNADRLLNGAPRVTHDGREVPALGGIPLLKKIGQGGMGAVYYGFHPRLAQEVAVKVLPFPLIAQDPIAVQRFYREAQIAAKVKSPHLVGVMDVNEEAGLFYLVMEYVNGVTAGSYLSNKKSATGRALDETEALDICIGAAQGLAAAHAEGIIHRDLKPDNILIPSSKQEAALLFENAKLADLGLARTDESGQSLTSSFSAMGSVGYMPPEQALDAKKVRKQGDVFSLGATLYALLSGRAPFQGTSTTAVLLDTLQNKHTPIRDLRPEISENTSRLIDKCLSKEPEKRFEDGDALLEALRACRALVGVAPKPAAPAAVTVAKSAAPAQTFANVPAPQAEPALELGKSELALTPMGAQPDDSLALEPIVAHPAGAAPAGPAPVAGAKKPAAKAGARPGAAPAAPRMASAPENAPAPKDDSGAPKSPLKMYAIAGAGIAVLLLVVFAAMYMKKLSNERDFLARRDRLLEDSRGALKGGSPEVLAAKKSVDEFLRDNAGQNASALTLVRDLSSQLSQRKEELDKRAQAFNDLLQKADRAEQAKALDWLRQAQEAGKADASKGYPDLNETVAPTVADRIEKAERTAKAAAAAAEEARQAYEKQMAEAKTALAANDFDKAEAGYKQALVHRPNDADAKAGLEKLGEARLKAEAEAKMAAGSEKRKIVMAAIEKAIEAQRIEDWPGIEKALAPIEKESIPDSALNEKRKQLLEIARSQLKGNSEADKLIEEGQQLVQAKKFDEALKSFQEAIALKPEARLDERVKKGMADAQAGTTGKTVAQANPPGGIEKPPAQGERPPQGQAERPPQGQGEKPPGGGNEGGPPNVSDKFKKAMAEGDRLMKAKKFQEAITQYNICLKERPGDPRASDCVRMANEAIQSGGTATVTLPPGGPPEGGGGEGGPPEGGPGGGQGGPGGRPPPPGGKRPPR